LNLSHKSYRISISRPERTIFWPSHEEEEQQEEEEEEGKKMLMKKGWYEEEGMG
jgi:hypothetical protein